MVDALDDIALGTALPSDARRAIADLAANLDGDAARRLYGVLRAWTWKALNERRRDEHLREWHDILRASAALLRRDERITAERIETLSELVAESIAVSGAFSVSDAMKRAQVRQIVDHLRANPASTLSQVSEALSCERGYTALLLNMMLNCELAWRAHGGREASYRLTRAGAGEAAHHAAAPAPDSVGQVVKREPPSVEPAPRPAGAIEKRPSHTESVLSPKAPSPIRSPDERREVAHA